MADRINNIPILIGKSAERFVKLMNEKPSKEKKDYWEKIEFQKKVPF